MMPLSWYSLVTSRVRALLIVISAYQDIILLAVVLIDKMIRFEETNAVSLISFLNITTSKLFKMHGLPVCSCFAVLAPFA
jgi:hypothetical protein